MFFSDVSARLAMRKLSMHRSGKGGGPKKVAPPSIPGQGIPQYYVGYTPESTEFNGLDQSYDSTHSEGKLKGQYTQ